MNPVDTAHLYLAVGVSTEYSCFGKNPKDHSFPEREKELAGIDGPYAGRHDSAVDDAIPCPQKFLAAFFRSVCTLVPASWGHTISFWKSWQIDLI